MNQMDRIYKIDALLANGRSRTLEFLLEELEVSRATFKRDIRFMKDRLNAPIHWDRETRGYRLSAGVNAGTRYELPGLWFNERELLALATMQ
ncbi:MAG: HTH domain-containing protein, partial [Pseudomonadota bacterium]